LLAVGHADVRRRNRQREVATPTVDPTHWRGAFQVTSVDDDMRPEAAGSQPTLAGQFLRALSAISVALAGGGRPSLAAKDAASAAIDQWCDAVADQYLRGDEFPADGGVPTLFGDDDDPAPPILRPGELSSTPRVTLPRDVTGIGGPTLERARQAVEVLRRARTPSAA
jgi:hypothetical protein